LHETREDLVALQGLLDRSLASAGPHLKSIITAERTMTAVEVCRRLEGMCLLAVATVTADGRPLVGPVDGIFYRGAFHFSSSADSVRFRHIRERPHVSASHLPGEQFAVTVHGHAEVIDLASAAAADFRRTLLDVYVPRYGPEWETVLDSGIACARVAPEKMFVFDGASLA
jgi:Pyridoxamine 5'-phosphate oxidase